MCSNESALRKDKFGKYSYSNSFLAETCGRIPRHGFFDARLGQVMVTSYSLYLSTCLKSNGRNDSATRFADSPQNNVFENVFRRHAIGQFREMQCLLISKKKCKRESIEQNPDSLACGAYDGCARQKTRSELDGIYASLGSSDDAV